MKSIYAHLVVGLALLASLLAASARASVTYSYVTDQSQYDGPAGGTITVNVYLKETLTGNSQSILMPSNENGLFGAGFKVSEVSNSLPSPSILTKATANDDSASQQFNGGAFNVVSVTNTVATLSESQSFSNTAGVQLGNHPALAGTVSTPGNQIFLGTVTITEGTSPGVTQFTLGAIGEAGTTVTYNDSDDLDGNSTSPAYTGVGRTLTTFSVGIPEPASMGLLGASIAFGLLKRRRRAF
jgi:hypothetical protein